MSSSTTRKTNMDLLRILMMFFVVIIHINGHGDIMKTVAKGSINYYVVHIINSLTQNAVPVFILISGYFGISFSYKKLAKFEFSLLFYSITMFMIFIIFKFADFNSNDLLMSIAPTSFKTWWFASIYIALMVLSPFLNILIKNITKIQHAALIASSFILFSVIASYSTTPIVQDNGHGIVNFCFLYIVGRYIKRYGLLNINKYWYLTCYFITSLTIAFTYFIFQSYHFGVYNSVLLIINSVCLFMFFERLDFKLKFASMISPYVFAVYLIHDNFYIRGVLYTKIFHTAHYGKTYLYILYVLATAITIFVICITIEWIRKLLFDKFENKFLDSMLFTKFIKFAERLFYLIFNIKDTKVISEDYNFSNNK